MTVAVRTLRVERSTRDLATGILFLLLAGFVVLVLPQGTAGFDSTFVLETRRAGGTVEAPDLVVPTQAALWVLGGLVAFAGGWQLARGFRRSTLAVALVSGMAIAAFLVWATKGSSLNLTGMLVSSLVRATPICFGALSGIYCERSGVINIAIEGMMLAGAFTAVVFASVTDSMLVGIIAALATGLLTAALHAVLSIRFRVDQIISGAVIIILALGITSYLQRAVLNVNRELNAPGPAIAPVPVPVLSEIPVLGPVLFNQSPLIYTLFFLLIATHFIMFQTRWGLRTRAVGEHPKAADTLGINVYKMRYANVLIGGAIAGLGGAFMSIGSAGRFNEGMTAGKGFLGLAAMIFGNWNPGGSFLGSLIFGFFDSWQEKLAILQVGIPIDLLGMAPFLATMIVLAGVVGRAIPPAADGQPYIKE